MFGFPRGTQELIKAGKGEMKKGFSDIFFHSQYFSKLVAALPALDCITVSLFGSWFPLITSLCFNTSNCLGLWKPDVSSQLSALHTLQKLEKKQLFFVLLFQSQKNKKLLDLQHKMKGCSLCPTSNNKTCFKNNKN